MAGICEGSVMKKWAIITSIGFLPALLWSQEKPLTNEDVVRLVKAGIGEQLVIEKISSSPGAFDTDVDALVELKSADVPERVIQAMLRKMGGKEDSSAPPSTAARRDTPSREGLSDEYFNRAQLFRPVGTKTDRIEGSLKLEPSRGRVQFVGKKAGEPLLDIPYEQVQKLVYEKSKKPRYALAVFVSPLFFFTKSKKHWLTVEYREPGQELRTVIIRLHKDNVDEALRRIERHTGVKVDYQATTG